MGIGGCGKEGGRTNGDVGAAGGEDAGGSAGGHGLDGLADAGQVSDGALGAAGDGIVDAGLGAGRDGGEVLSGDEADEGGEDGGSELHICGFGLLAKC